MMSEIKKILTLAGLGLGALAILVSCREDIPELTEPSSMSDRIVFTIVDDNFIVSRPDSQDNPEDVRPSRTVKNFPVEIGDDSFLLKMSTDDNNTSSMFARKDTKGMTYVTSSVSSFNVKAITSAGNQLYFDDVVAVEDFVASSKRFWPAGALTFFAHYIPEAALPSLTYDCADGTARGTFSYALPDPSSEGNDAEVQKDMIFAIAPDVTGTGGGVQSVSLKFHHALSALVFKLGKMPEGVTVKNIRLLNFKSSGDCVMTPEGTGNLKFDWTAGGEKKSYQQDFSETQILSEIQTFMMIPQSFSDNPDAVLEINFVKGGLDYKMHKPMKDIIASIDADTKYVFNVGVSEVRVEILEDFDGIVKSNVRFKNTGNTTAYVRATIVGYWIDRSGDIVAPWTDFIVPPTTSGWRYNDADGFYYYKIPVAPGDVTADLIESYSWNREPAVLNSTLHLNIVAQIVSVSKFEEGIWGSI